MQIPPRIEKISSQTEQTEFHIYTLFVHEKYTRALYINVCLYVNFRMLTLLKNIMNAFVYKSLEHTQLLVLTVQVLSINKCPYPFLAMSVLLSL